jgi:hypothetical protein
MPLLTLRRTPLDLSSATAAAHRHFRSTPQTYRLATSTSTSTSAASRLTLTGYDSSLSSASYPDSPGSDFSPSRRPLRSSRRSTRRTLYCTRRAPPQTRSLAAHGHGHVTTLQRAPRYPAPTRTFSSSRVASAAPLATTAAAPLAPPAAPLAGPAPSLALSPGSCRSFSGRVARHSAFGEVAGNQCGAHCVLHPASSIQHSLFLPSSSTYIYRAG